MDAFWGPCKSTRRFTLQASEGHFTATFKSYGNFLRCTVLQVPRIYVLEL